MTTIFDDPAAFATDVLDGLVAAIRTTSRASTAASCVRRLSRTARWPS